MAEPFKVPILQAQLLFLARCPDLWAALQAKEKGGMLREMEFGKEKVAKWRCAVCVE